MAIAELVGCTRLRVDGGGGDEERRSQFVGVVRGEPERGKYPRLVLAPRMLRIQAVSRQLLPINDRGVAAWYLHLTT
jgi:hypothetical protein